MKIRTDFVTNSSSSSFICDICGRNETGWDMSLSEADMMECVNGHVFCCGEALSLTKQEMVETILKNKWNENFVNFDLEKYQNYTEEEICIMNEDELWEKFYCGSGGNYNVQESICPICQFVEYSEKDLSEYLLKEYGVSRDKVFEEVKKVNRRRKKLYENEYITYVCKQFNLEPAEIVASWKEKFITYKNFKTWLNS